MCMMRFIGIVAWSPYSYKRLGIKEGVRRLYIFNENGEFLGSTIASSDIIEMYESEGVIILDKEELIPPEDRKIFELAESVSKLTLGEMIRSIFKIKGKEVRVHPSPALDIIHIKEKEKWEK